MLGTAVERRRGSNQGLRLFKKLEPWDPALNWEEAGMKD